MATKLDKIYEIINAEIKMKTYEQTPANQLIALRSFRKNLLKHGADKGALFEVLWVVQKEIVRLESDSLELHGL